MYVELSRETKIEKSGRYLYVFEGSNVIEFIFNVFKQSPNEKKAQVAQ